MDGNAASLENMLEKKNKKSYAKADCGECKKQNDCKNKHDNV